jgi:hypothetical protein
MVLALATTAVHDAKLHKLQALNEESQIQQCISNLLQLHPPIHEVIVVDGGSRDR